jgi:hypothetical protein
VSSLLIRVRLPVDQFKPRRDQRQAVNKWNKHVLGDEYIKESTRLYPKSKEWVDSSLKGCEADNTAGIRRGGTILI